MSALHLAPAPPASEPPVPAVPPARRLAAVPPTVSTPPHATPGNVRPTADRPTPGESVQSQPSLRAVDETREICAITRGTVQAAIEVLAGTRPLQQLSRRLDPRCLASLQHRAALTRRLAAGSAPTAGRLHRNPTVRSVRACEVAAGIYEASAVVVDELRVRAVAVRLERSNQVWRITALEIG